MIIKIHRDFQWGTLVKYSQMASRAISIALTCSLNSECEFNAPMNLEQQSICAELPWAMVTNGLPNAHVANQWDGEEDNEDTEEVGDDEILQ